MKSAVAALVDIKEDGDDPHGLLRIIAAMAQ